MQPVSLAKLGFDHERCLVLVCGTVAVAGIEELSGRAVRRPEHPDVHAEETIAHVEGTLQLPVASWCRHRKGGWVGEKGHISQSDYLRCHLVGDEVI